MTLMEYLPEAYAGSPETVCFQQALQPEADALWAARDEMLRQLDPRTAAGWGLALWEAAFGLTPAADAREAFRQTRVAAKIRGAGTVTAAMIRSVAESFSNGQSAVVEVPRESRLEIHFVGTVGIPPNMDDLAAALEEIIPAHLAWEFVIYYRTHRNLQRLTHRRMAAYTHITLREEKMDDGDGEV